MHTARVSSLLFHRIAIAILLASVLGGCDQSSTDVVHFTQAEHRMQSPSIIDKGPPPARYTTPVDAEWTQVGLPHVTPRPITGANMNVANTVWETNWYRLRWQPQSAIGGALAVYIPRRHMG